MAAPSPSPSPPVTDAEQAAALRWLRASAEGDRAAFERLYRLMHPRLVRFLARLCPRRDLVDEAINDAMMVVWRNAGDFRGDSKVSTWLTGIAYRCMLKTLRQSPPAEVVGETALDGDAYAHGSDAERDHELRDWLSQGLATLTEDQRHTVLLAYAVGESCEGIADIMGCAVGTVKARLFHARVRLRNVLPALAGELERTEGQQR